VTLGADGRTARALVQLRAAGEPVTLGAPLTDPTIRFWRGERRQTVCRSLA
jgi:hypothetical protein